MTVPETKLSEILGLAVTPAGNGFESSTVQISALTEDRQPLVIHLPFPQLLRLAHMLSEALIQSGWTEYANKTGPKN